MVEPRRRVAASASQARERVLVVDQVRADQLRDDDRVQVLVEGEVRLVVVAAAESLQRQAAGDDLVALGQSHFVFGSVAVVIRSDRRAGRP